MTWHFYNTIIITGLFWASQSQKVTIGLKMRIDAPTTVLNMLLFGKSKL